MTAEISVDVVKDANGNPEISYVSMHDEPDTNIVVEVSHKRKTVAIDHMPAIMDGGMAGELLTLLQYAMDEVVDWDD